MAIAHVAALGANQSKTAGTSLAASGSQSVSAGDTVFVAFASDDVGSAFGVTSNLGGNISWSQVGTTKTLAGAIKTQLWKGDVTTGGTLTSVTMSWTTNITAKAIAVGIFSGVGSEDLTGGIAASSSSVQALVAAAFQTGDLLIGACGVEDNIVPDVSGGTAAGSNFTSASAATSGGGSSSNIGVTLGYCIASNPDSTAGIIGLTDGTQNGAGAGAVYSPATAAFNTQQRKQLIHQQNIRRASFY